MKKFFTTLLILCLMVPTTVFGYMDIDKAANYVDRITSGKMSAWDTRGPAEKQPILSKTDAKKMFEGRTRVGSFETTGEGGIRFVDLRKFDSPVKSQGQTSWCTAFATAAVIENSARQQGRMLDLSETYLWNLYHEYDMYMAAKAASENYLVPEQVWPWEAEKPVKGAKEKGVVKLIAGTEMTAISEAIKALDQGKPIMFGATTTPVWGSPNKGVIAIKGEEEGGHAIAVVGYYIDPTNEVTGGGFLIFKNSWGTKWGDNGYGYLPFAYCKKYDCYFIRADGVTFR